MRTKIELILIAIALGTSPAAAGALGGKSPAGSWYDVSHEDRDAWISHVVAVADTTVPRDRLGPQVRECLHDTAEAMEKLDLAEVTALCIMRAR